MLGSTIITNKIVDILSEDNNNVKENKEIYNYCLDYIFENIIYSSLTLLIGAFFNCLLPTFIFIITIFSLRSYAGGAHANTRKSCTVISFSIYIASIIVASCTELFPKIIWLLLYLIAMTLINILGPIETPQKPLSISKRHLLKKKLHICTIGLTILFTILYLYNFTICYKLITVCAIITIISMFFTIKNRHHHTTRGKNYDF